MKPLFAVIRVRGAAWDQSLPLEAQPAWPAHAAFMNGLEAEGFVVLGGPLEGTSEVLLIVRAENDAEVRSRLAADPWSGSDLLRVARTAPWTLRFGSLEDNTG